MKKVLYIYYVPFISKLKGVYKKLLIQVKNSYDTNIDFLLLTCEDSKDNYSNLFIEKLPVSKLKRIKDMSIMIEKYAKEYEVIVFRKVMYNPYILKTFYILKKKYNIQIITDHQTKEIPQHFTSKSILKYIRILNEYIGIGFMKTFNLVDKIVGVTDEIVEYEKKIYHIKEGFVIGNGIDIENNLYFGYTPYKKGGKLVLVISLGDYYPWHGVERLLKSIDKYKNNIDFQLNILLGSKSDILLNLVKTKNYVKLYYNLSEKEMKKIYKESNLAISTIALYIKQMNEAAPLKSREYIQRSIPFIYGYYDVDLSNTEIDKYLYRVSNDDSIIDFDKVVEFLNDLNHENLKNDFEKFSVNKLSWKVKLEKLQDFINKGNK